jgi:hypothetical protein
MTTALVLAQITIILYILICFSAIALFAAASKAFAQLPDSVASPYSRNALVAWTLQQNVALIISALIPLVVASITIFFVQFSSEPGTVLLMTAITTTGSGIAATRYFQRQANAVLFLIETIRLAITRAIISHEMFDHIVYNRDNLGQQDDK